MYFNLKAYKKLNQIAFTQGGLFTAKQAESCGYEAIIIIYQSRMFKCFFTKIL